MKKYWNDYTTAAMELHTLTQLDADELSIHEIDTILTLLEDCFNAAHTLNDITYIYEEEYEFYTELRETKLSAAEYRREGYEEFCISIDLYY